MEQSQAELENYTTRIEQLAQQLGLDYFPVDFELVPNNFRFRE